MAATSIGRRPFSLPLGDEEAEEEEEATNEDDVRAMTGLSSRSSPITITLTLVSE